MIFIVRILVHLRVIQDQVASFHLLSKIDEERSLLHMGLDLKIYAAMRLERVSVLLERLDLSHALGVHDLVQPGSEDFEAPVSLLHQRLRV